MNFWLMLRLSLILAIFLKLSNEPVVVVGEQQFRPVDEGAGDREAPEPAVEHPDGPVVHAAL